MIPNRTDLYTNAVYWEFSKMLFRDHPFSTYAKFPEKTNFSYPVIRTRAFAYKGLRNISFLENFTYVLNGWSFTWQHRKAAVLILCYYYWLLIVQFLFQPEVVGTLSSLRELWLDGNKIKQLPPVSSIWIVNL